jgi:phospholipid/cholesterol/gamma-HCH transport system substrate-binding protein
MNEREMQFRIGFFVIVAGLTLTMLIIWFGESPSLLRKHTYVTVHYSEAPGVAEGIPVRKSGIRVGEVTSITFDERPNQPDGVLVTLSLDGKYHFRAGTVPRVNRTFIGDASIDLLPGTGTEWLELGDSPRNAPIIEGAVAPDPSKALAAVTIAFEKVGDTLKTIDKAANGLARVSENSDKLSEFLTTWRTTGQRVASAADGIDRFIKDNEQDFKPAVANLRDVSRKLNETLDPATQDALRSGVKQFAVASGQLSTSLASAAPLFKDLGAPVNSVPTTDFGQAVRRLNLITSDVNLLTQTLRGRDGKLNSEGSFQRLVTQKELYENVNHFATSGTAAFEGLKPVIAAFRAFAERISRDPSALTRGALSR